MARTRHILSTTPLIDGHNDLPYLMREQLRNKIYGSSFRDGLLSHTDIAKLRKGLMGGQFWSVYVPCPGAVTVTEAAPVEPGIDDPNWAVRDTLEQIDVTKRFVAEYSDTFQLCTTSSCARSAFNVGKIASMIGIEGGHQTGNSLGAIRIMFDMGARYITLTHDCDNAFGTAWTTVDSGKEDKGLASFGREFVRELNRLGMMIDLAHVSHNTMRDVIAITRAPVIFSHSGAYSVEPHLRHAPDDVLRSMKENGGVIMVPFVTQFLNIEHPENATVEDVVDHIMRIAELAGWVHVGIGSDFDGTPNVPKGLEDASQYPNLIAALLARGATDAQARGVAGENILRAWRKIEDVAQGIQKEERPNEEVWEGRSWGPENIDLPRMFERCRGSGRHLIT
ncbi:hypothetical protein DTO271D3_748 [Paecilomyces variotii]|nr:hypothetical protein DTO169C6_8155 [Paecilomyces variotii]KAJ9319160.1 hypothetical protein DTO271D3_748 [Paecilomyces variotii]KAJ9361907.1 hypothetical protein DTO027B9_338 [Paecilomyces variotii]